MTEPTRRHLLALAGMTVAGMSGGCATMIDGIGAEQTTNTRDRTQTTVRDSPQTTTTEESTTRESTPESTTTESMPEPDSVQITTPTIFPSSIPIPSNPGAHDYAVMGDPDNAPTATIYGSWKCPFTQAFVRNTLPDLVDEFIIPGDIALEFRAVAYMNDEPFLGPDAPRATRAGLAAWNVDPTSYWSYFAYIFDNQPPEGTAWAQPDILTRFATQADVEPVTRFQDGFRSTTHRDAVQQTVREFQFLGEEAVPRVVTEDAVTAPTVDPSATREQLRALADQESAD